MAKRTRGIRKHGARVLLSDILPYELPPSFNNRGFYNFVQANGVKLTQDGPVARKGDDFTEALLRVAFGREIAFANRATHPKGALLATGATAKKPTIPFQFTVRHRANDHRTLTVPHPAAQLDIVDFYEHNADLILFHTGKSDFSLRHPTRKARYTVVRDWLYGRLRRPHFDAVEEDEYEYEWIRSYFAYAKYSNIYKFYESPQYRDCERRFSYLVKVDVAKCFDSIYTHSIAWATENHEVVKANIGKGGKLKLVSPAFGDAFDKLMQGSNHAETSGITIGSEVSRVFAEIVLQAVDVDVKKRLQELDIVFGVDYEILRYVDDYFVFLADPAKRDAITTTLSNKLRKYKLHLNASKEQGEFTPWLSPLSAAKQRLVDLLREHVKRGEAEDGSSLPRPFVRTAGLIVGYKSILLDTGVSHFDLANYALLQSERRIEKLLRASREAVREGDTGPDVVSHASTVTTALLNMIDFSFFVYSGAPRMSPAVKIARIVSTILRFARQPNVAAHDRERIEMRVRRELVQQLRRSSRSEQPGVVTATLVDCLSDLGPGFRCGENDLAEWCGFTKTGRGWQAPTGMNALLLFSLLLHMRDHPGYKSLRAECSHWVLSVQDRSPLDGERALVALNMVTCPWVSLDLKQAILGKYGHGSKHPAITVPARPDGWNINWREFDLYAALQAKRLYEVY